MTVVALSEASDLRARFQPVGFIGLQAGGEAKAGVNDEPLNLGYRAYRIRWLFILLLGIYFEDNRFDLIDNFKVFISCQQRAIHFHTSCGYPDIIDRNFSPFFLQR